MGDVVKMIERQGSQSGKTKCRIVVNDCGELGGTNSDNDGRGAAPGYPAVNAVPTPNRVPDGGGEMQPIPGHKTTYQVLKPGRGGPKVRKGSNVVVHATGVVKESGNQFWSTKDPGQEPFGYQAGVGGVITGWDQGCLGMEVGEVRELLIPANEGYGSKGFPAWGIPPGGTLNFTLECLKIK